MAGPVMRQRGPVEVEFFGFCLQERDEAAVPVQFPEDWDTGGGFLTAREGRLDVRSAGHTHTADLMVECGTIRRRRRLGTGRRRHRR